MPSGDTGGLFRGPFRRLSIHQGNMAQNTASYRRWLYLAVAAVVLALGASARAYAVALPLWLGAYAPDTLWALLVLLLVAALKPAWTARRQAGAALGFAYLIECCQLYQAPWINALRGTRLGGLVLGHGFLWSDLLCYTVGIGLGALLSVWLGRIIPSIGGKDASAVESRPNA